jgi:hypothetical protein
LGFSLGGLVLAVAAIVLLPAGLWGEYRPPVAIAINVPFQLVALGLGFRTRASTVGKAAAVLAVVLLAASLLAAAWWWGAVVPPP